MKNINDMSEEEQIKIIKKDPYNIRYIENPTSVVQLAAVERYGTAIEYIENPSEEVQIAAVKKVGSAIKFINNPSENVQLAAVQEEGDAIYFIENPSKDVVITAILKLIQTENEYDYLIDLIEEYEHNNWPELDIIKNSLRADKKIK